MAFNFLNVIDPVGAALGVHNKSSSSGGAAAAAGIDPAIQGSLAQYYESEPVFAQTYAAARAAGDTRSALEWMYDHIQASPGDLVKFNNLVKNGGALADGETQAPLEQALLDQIFADYINPDLAGDPARRAQAQAIVDRINAGVDGAQAVNRRLLDGSRLAEEYAMADATGARLAGSAVTQGDQMRAALAQMEAERNAALDPLNAQRLAAAETQAASVNQALQSERDRITAQLAGQGFVGGSTFNDAALTRAGITARQNAAGIVGAANVANATDRRSIADQASGLRFDIMGQQSTGERAGADRTTNDRQQYFDNDYVRQLEASLRVPTLEASRLNYLDTADNFGQSGLRRSLDTLNWWASDTAPGNVNPYYNQVDTWGSDLAGLGAGISGSALAVGNSLRWGQNKTPAADTPKTPTATVYV